MTSAMKSADGEETADYIFMSIATLLSAKCTLGDVLTTRIQMNDAMHVIFESTSGRKPRTHVGC